MSIEAAPPERPSQSHRRYTWPRFILAGLILGVVLAFLWLSFEIKRTRQYRQNVEPDSSRQSAH